MISMRSLGIYGSALFTREEVALGNSDLVERFVSASLKGWMHAIKNPGDVASRIAEQLTRSLPVDDPLDLNLHQYKHNQKKLRGVMILLLGLGVVEMCLDLHQHQYKQHQQKNH